MAEIGTMRVKSGLAEMLKGGVIMDVVNSEQARIAEDAGAVAVMALERVPADIRAQGGVARMADPEKIQEIQEAVTIPVMAKCRIGHFAEAQILQALEVDYIDESEVLTPADVEHHVDKWQFTVPFVCGATNLGEALRRIAEGAAMIRTKGEAGTGDIVNAVTHMRSVFGGIRRLQSLRDEELYTEAKELRAPYDLVRWVAEHGRLPVVTFTAGGIATPADASLCMQLGADGVFVGSGIFKSGDPEKRGKAIVEATTHYSDAEVLARVSAGLGEPMVGISASSIPPEELLETRGLVAGHLEFLAGVRSPRLGRRHELALYMPPSYATSRRRYPVVYAHDGQNLFDDERSYAGEWGFDETMEALATEGIEAIVVGIPNAGEKRADEYSPSARGAAHVADLADAIKPAVDARFRTRPEPAHTTVLGSSLGGLISMYAFVARPDAFGAAGVLSPAFWFAGERIFESVAARPRPRGRVYIDAGTEEGDEYVAGVRRMAALLDAHELRVVVEDGAVHHESAWGRRLPDALRFLLG